jgi:serine/threonine-protein kinase
VAERYQLGKYRLVAELGHGGMADVYLALVEGPTGSGFSKLAVVKRLRANLAEDPEFVAMLVDEARITARLNHPNVVQMLEVGVANDEYFLAMEYLDGQPLHRIERRASRMGVHRPVRLRLSVLADVLSGLHHAHELADYDGSPLGIVHRDVTPQNVFVTYDGHVKVMDFGIAKAAGRAQETMQGIVKGKVRYMSPEQAMGQPLDRRADVFAVGVMLWQAATGMRFWGDLDELAIVQALIGGEFEASPRAVCPDVPEELDRICRKALERHADARYATALDLRADLEAFLGATAVNGRREIAQIVNQLFEKERRELRAIIERAGRDAARAKPSVGLLASRSGSMTVTAAASASTSASLAPFAHTVPPSDGRVVTVASIAPPGAPNLHGTMPPPARTARALFAASFAVAVAAIVTAGIITTQAQREAARAPIPATVTLDHVGFASSPYRTRHVEAPPTAERIVVVEAPPAPTHAPIHVAEERPTEREHAAPPVERPAPPARTTVPSALPGLGGKKSNKLTFDSSDPWAKR